MVEAQDEEDEEEHVLKANEASDDELEVEYQEAVAPSRDGPKIQSLTARAHSSRPHAQNLSRRLAQSTNRDSKPTVSDIIVAFIQSR